MRERPGEQFYDINEGTWTTGGVNTRFYTRSVQDQSASDAAGRPVFKDVVYLLKEVPGDRFNRPDRPMRESDKREFPEQWKRFEEGLSQKHEGLPLAEWPQISRSQVEELTYFRVYTVEELARLPDAAQGQMGVLFLLRDKARSYLDRAAGDAQEAQLRAEKEQAEQRAAKADEERRALEERLAKLEEQLAHQGKKAK